MPGVRAHIWRLWRSGCNGAYVLLTRQRIRALSMVMVILIIWALLGAIFISLLSFLGQDLYLTLKPFLVDTLLALFFFTLFVLVTLSDMVVVWSCLFTSRAAHFHAQLPLTDRALYWNAALEGGFWSSWAVIVLLCPLIGALVLDRALPLLLPPVRLPAGQIAAMALGCLGAALAFVGCCIASGAVAALLMARLIPILRRRARLIGILLAALLLALIVMASGLVERHLPPTTFLNAVIGRLRFAATPWLPAAWAQQAFSAALDGRWDRYARSLALLVSTSLAIGIAGEALAHARLRRELDSLSGRGDPARTLRSRPWRLLPGLDADLALLVAKDIRLFRRDPAQLVQFTMFFLMLAIYLLLLPRIGHAFLADPWWHPVVALLNLTAVTMALATFTGRFVFPLLSIEGRRLWVLCLAPWPRTRVVTAKLIFALLVGVPVSLALVILSGWMLNLPATAIAGQALTIVCMACGFSTCALGLGARLADYEEDNAAKLVAGYGGTLNLLVSLIYTALIMAGAILPATGLAGRWGWPIGLAWMLAVTALWSTCFLRLAWRWFAR